MPTAGVAAIDLKTRYQHLRKRWVKADIIELDVHLSKDGGLIVMHDETVDRTTNGKGRICDLTVAELKELNAGSWFSEEFQAAKIPTLKEVLDLLAAKNYRGILTIELKTDHYEYEGIEAKVSDLLNSQEWPFTHWYCSFNIETLDRMHAIEPDATLDFIMGRGRQTTVGAQPTVYRRNSSCLSLDPRDSNGLN